jgi:hypothetical protein
VTPRSTADPELARRLLDTVRNETRRKREQEARYWAAIQEAVTANSLRDVAEAAGIKSHQTITNRLKQGDAMIARYYVEGRITVGGVAIGRFDAGGGEWVDSVEEILSENGYRCTGGWDGDSPDFLDAPVARI